MVLAWLAVNDKANNLSYTGKMNGVGVVFRTNMAFQKVGATYRPGREDENTLMAKEETFI